MSKIKKHFKHTALRCKQRFGVELTLADYAYIVHKIQRGGLVPQEDRFKVSGSRSIQFVNYKDKKIPFVYSSTSSSILTALPSEKFNKGKEIGKVIHAV